MVALRRPDWQHDAACLGLTADEADEGFFGKTLPDWAAELCAGCPVRRECYRYAVEINAVGHGGGVHEKDRRAAMRQKAA